MFLIYACEFFLPLLKAMYNTDHTKLSFEL
jgi:hypothetical protein